MAVQIVQYHEAVGGFATGSIDRRGYVTYRRRYRIYDDTGAALEEAGVLGEMRLGGYEIHTAHPTDTYARIISIDTERTKNRKEWLATVTWSNAPLEFSPVEHPVSTDPLSDPPVVRVTSQDYTRLLETDLTPPPDGPKPVANSAGAMYDPVPELPAGNTIVHIEANYALPLELDKVQDFRYATNSQPYTLLGYPASARETLLRKIDGETRFSNNAVYMRMIFELELSSTPWNPIRIVDQGSYGIDEGKTYVIKDADGTPLQDWHPLNGEGQPLPPGAPLFYNEFMGYKERDFNDLNLPAEFP